ncbi:hypothetical protein BGX27_005211 [Mortierella sp. AM989]|nr:hypothetical protein BGX27_005211 [Mortierella sp. AM989]
MQDTSNFISQEQIKDSLFSPLFNTRWAASASVQEPNCVSFQDHGLGTAPIDNIKVVNDLNDQSIELAMDRAEEERWLKEQSVSELNADQSGLFEYSEEGDNDNENDLVKTTLKARHLSRRERGKHHHHSNQQKHHHHHEKRDADHPAEGGKVQISGSETEPKIKIRADQGHDQTVYSVSHENGNTADVAGGVLLHESLNHAETNKGQQKALVQAGTESADLAAGADSLAKASAGHLSSKNATDTTANDQGEASNPDKGTMLLAAIPILLLMGAIAGFTAYRRYYENSFNEGGRNDTRDEYPTDGYYRRDVPIRKGSPIHFDRTFLNTVHSPPPTATYLRDPDNSSRNQSPSSVASVSMKRPPPSAGSLGKTRFKELSRSYDFGAGFRTIKNALTRSNNNSREGALDKASGPSAAGSGSSLPGKSVNYAFGAGGHSIAKIGSHPGLNALERQRLQQQYSAGGGGSSNSRFPDMNTLTINQEHSIIWGQYSADGDGTYQDAASAVASNLARKSVSSNSLSLISTGKYSHHHQQSSGHQPDTPTDSIGDYLSPESPSMTRADMMRRRALYSEGYTFGSEKSAGDDAHSGTDLLFDARDNFLDFGSEKVHEASLALEDDEMDMYLSMEKEESPYIMDDYNTMNPTPYEPKVLTRHVVDTSMIQKTADMSEKESYPLRPSLDRVDEEFDEKKALETENQAAAASVVTKQLEVPEETHVLGCASPEWTASENVGRAENVRQIPTTGAFSRVQAAISSFNDSNAKVADESIADQPLDLREWEEGPSNDSTASLSQQSGSQQTQGQGKKKGNKSKAKKGRKH